MVFDMVFALYIVYVCMLVGGAYIYCFSKNSPLLPILFFVVLFVGGFLRPAANLLRIRQSKPKSATGARDQRR